MEKLNKCHLYQVLGSFKILLKLDIVNRMKDFKAKVRAGVELRMHPSFFLLCLLFLFCNQQNTFINRTKRVNSEGDKIDSLVDHFFTLKQGK